MSLPFRSTGAGSPDWPSGFRTAAYANGRTVWARLSLSVAMPRFHFDVRYGSEPWSEDPDGTNLLDAREARSEAVTLMAELVLDHLREYQEIAVRVRDGQPTPLLTLTLAMDAQERESR